MKTIKSLLAIFCATFLFFVFCGDVFAVTVRTSNSVKQQSALPDGLNDSKKYKVSKYEVIDGNTVQITLENGKTYRAILYGVEVPKTWEDWQVEAAKKKLNEMLGKATTITAQVWSNKAKNKTRIHSGSRGTTVSGSATTKTLIVKLFAKNNSDFGKLMLQEGYAICYDAEIDSKGLGGNEYPRAQAQAQRETKGCWAPKPDEKPEPEPEPEPSEENPDEDYFKF